jgi:hypothetical protein
MARKPTSSARAAAPARAHKPAADTAKVNGADVSPVVESPPPAKKPVNGRPGSAAAVEVLLGRGDALLAGAAWLRSDPLLDAQAVAPLAEALAPHARELTRRGLPQRFTEAAVQIGREIETNLQALSNAAVAARVRSPDDAELLADAAHSATTVRDAIARVCRGPEGRSVARAFGLGESFSARQPSHVLRGLRRILEAVKLHPEVAADAGLLSDDLQTIRGLAEDLEGFALPIKEDDASDRLHRFHAALRCYFDLVAAKLLLGLAGDPVERTRLLGLIPRTGDRRLHARQA